MEIESAHGLTTGVVSIDEALAMDWPALQPKVDVVRVIDPDPGRWGELLRADFAIMPACVTWIAPVSDTESGLLGRLSRNERRNLSRSIRFVADHDIQLRVVAPLDERSFDAFLELYVNQVSGMRHGVPFARLQRPDILARAGEYFVVEAWAGGTLLGSCVCLDRADASTVLVRFTATTPEGRRSRTVRAMYARMFQVARERGRDTVSLGTDPALYGHIAKPGLFRFKSRLGFTPIPARIFGSDDDPDEAGRVLRLDALTEPSLQLSYHLPATGGTGKITAETGLRLDVLTGDSNIDIGPYRAAFLADIGVRRVGP